MKQTRFQNIFFSPRFKYYVLPLAFILSIFFLIPYELYYNAQIYWGWKKLIPFTVNLVGIIAYGTIVLLLKLLFHFKKESAAKIISFLLFFAGTFILFADVFAPLQTGLATGEKLVSTEPVTYTIIEFGIFGFLAALFVYLGFDSGVKVGSIFCCILLAISLGYSSLVIFSGRPVTTLKEKRQANGGKIKGNVYHILLDEMQSDAARIYLTEGKNAEKYKGFTFFQNNTSNYLCTHASFPSYTTSTFYEGGSFENWFKGVYKERGLFKALYEKGYQIHIYAYSYDWKVPFATEFRTLDDIYEDVTKLKYGEFRDFTVILFARIMPNFLTNEALALGRRISKHVFLKISRTVRPRNNTYVPVAYAEGKEPFSSVLAFKRLIETEKNRPANGQYIYIHCVLPHPPYVYGREGDYNLKYRETGVNGYYGQVQYAFKLVETFINELKALGRYDDSTIIVHGDTGHSKEGFFFKKEGKLSGTLDKEHMNAGLPRMGAFFKERNHEESRTFAIFFQDHILSRTCALLMIKPAHSAGPLKISDRPTQLADLYPTLADLLNLKTIENEKVQGISVFSDTFPKNRERHFFWFPQKDLEPDIMNLKISNSANIRKATITFEGYVGTKEVSDFPIGGLTIHVGAQEEAGVKFKGFGAKGVERNKLTYRWAVGKEGKIIFSAYKFDEETKLIFSFAVKPFLVNENKYMVLSTPLSTAKVFLLPGLKKYSVRLTFPAGASPVIDIRYADAKSPEKLGIGKDVRELAALWSIISLRYPPSTLSRKVQEKPLLYEIGGTEEHGMDFEGFSRPEENGQAHWRWGTGERNRIIFKELVFKKKARLRVNIHVKPFVPNENRLMTLGTALSSAKLKLKPGFHRYSVSLEFPKGQSPSMDIYYEKTASPKSLGLGKDQRKLSVLWSELEISRLK